MSKTKNATPPRESRKPWHTPAVKTMGSISELVQTGGGKVSTAPGDPGEPRKVSTKG